MLISVIIPSYNRALTVGQTIESILSQTVNAEIEIIIGDDCSTDNTREVLSGYKELYPDIIHLIFHKKNIGLGANWAICVKACQGKYICNCDNDDYWHNPNKLQLQLDYLESHPKSNVLITDYRTHDRNTGEIKEQKAYIDRTLPLQQVFFQGKVRICNAAIMYRADFLMERLPLDDFIKYQFSLQDWIAWVVLSAYSDFDILNVSTATFGIETTSITRPDSLESLQRRMGKDFECYKYCCSLFPEDLFFNEEEWNTYVDTLLLSMSYKLKDFGNAQYYARKLSGRSSNKKLFFAKNKFLFNAYCALRALTMKLRTNYVNSHRIQ